MGTDEAAEDKAAQAKKAAAEEAKQRKIFQAIFPGKVFEIKGQGDEVAKISIFPIGAAHLRQFTEQIERIVPKIVSQVDLTKLHDGKEAFKELLPMIAPIIVGDLLDLVSACVTGIDLTADYLPHWFLPQIVEIWLLESFGDPEKIKPWITIIETIMEKTTGTRLQIWGELSKSLSRAVTPSKPSSENSSEESPTPDGP